MNSFRIELNRRSGVARVNAVWMIFALVMMLVAMAFGFIAHGDMTAAQEEAATARTQAQTDQEALSEALRRINDVSKPLGFFDRSQTGLVEADVDAATAALRDAVNEFGLGDDIDAFDKLPQQWRDERARLFTQINELQSRIGELEGERDAKSAEIVSVRSQKDTVIARLEGEKADAQSNHDTALAEKQDQIDSLRDQVARLDRELRQEQADHEALARQMTRDHQNYESRVQQLASALEPIRPPLDTAVDATVLETSDELSLGWIDIGSENRLVVGTTFDVYNGRLDDGPFKARAVVTRTEARKAEVRFFDHEDRLVPVVSGDVLKNPLYDPHGEHNAILVGRFDGAYSEKDLGHLLRRIGINVQDQWDVTTHFMIVGAELWVDEEGDPLDEPRQPSELAEYKDAEANGVVILPVADLRGYFQL